MGKGIPKTMLKIFARTQRSAEELKQEAQKQIRTISKQHPGLGVYDSNLYWLNDPEFNKVVHQWRKVPGLPRDRRFFIYNTAKFFRKIPGHTADIGIRFGSSSYYILQGFADPRREHHLFDSFAGVSSPTAEDGKSSVWEKGMLAVDENTVRKNLANFPNCHFHKGWIPERFPEVKDKQFAFVHIDVDLYQPTLDSLNFFYNKVVPGGVILCDDYGSLFCPGAKQAMEEFFADKKEAIIHIPTGQGLVIKA